MGIEFTVVKEAATISATLSELAAVDRIICAEIDSQEFRRAYDDLLIDITNTYRAFLELLRPLTEPAALPEFRQRFQALHQSYSDRYQAVHSESRVNAEFTYDKYLQFRKRREVATNYPSLKKAFARLHDLIDKWLDNDIWLALSIDTVFKRLKGVLDDVADMNARDPESAFDLYTSCVGSLPPYLQVIAGGLENMEATRAGQGSGAVAAG